MSKLKPLVVVTADQKEIGGHPSFALGRKYVDPVMAFSDCLPLVLPPLGKALPVDELLARIDGIVFTGSPSNINPQHYGQSLLDDHLPKDHDRDATTLPLIPRALALGIPILAICRGFQEVNVALGGALHQRVHEQPGKRDHREDKTAPLHIQYGEAHAITAVAGGRLHCILGQREIRVNSVHGQGVETLAPTLVAEAFAEDGLVEAYTHKAASFLLAVQWHPEWQTADNPMSIKIFKAFGQACRAFAEQRAV